MARTRSSSIASTRSRSSRKSGKTPRPTLTRQPHDDPFVPVRNAVVAAGIEWIVIVVRDEEPPGTQRQNALDATQTERERVPEASIAGLGWQRDSGGIAEVEQVHDLPLRHEPVSVLVGEVDLVDPLEHRLGALVIVSLHDQEAVALDQLGVGHEPLGILGAVGPTSAGETAVLEVELIDVPPALVRI